MTTPVAVDAERLVGDWLRSQLAGVTVASEVPAGHAWPVVRFTQIGGVYPVRGWLRQARIQIDSFAATKAAASLLCRQVEAAMFDLPGQRPLGTVTGVNVELSQLWQPDTETGAARYLSDFSVYLHP